MKHNLALIIVLLVTSATAAWPQTTDTVQVTTDTLLTTGILVPIGATAATSPTVIIPLTIDQLTTESRTVDAGEFLEDPRVLGYELPPPLSIAQADYILRASIFLLDIGQTEVHELERPNLQRSLNQVRNYIALLDQRYSTLWDYQWLKISEENFAKNKTNDIEFRPASPLRGVSAIGLEVLDADLIVEQLQVWDEETTCAETANPLRIQQGLPRKEVFFLFSPNITLAKIIVTAEPAEADSAARLILYAGITPQPEYAKYALREISKAQALIDAQLDAEAIQTLETVREYLLNFQKQQGLDKQPRS